jgi:hypothetical protein
MNRTLVVVAAALLVAAQVGQGPPAPKPRPAAPAADGARTLLYPARAGDVPAVLRPHVAALLSRTQAKVAPELARPAGVYLRVVSRRHALDGAAPGAGAWLGGRPAVFLTLPEAAYGRNLAQVYSAIGYDPLDMVTGELNVEKVAILFAYPAGAAAAADAPAGADWDRRVYPATWDNLFELARRLAADPARRTTAGGFVPDKLQLKNDDERALLVNFPGDLALVRNRAGYAALRAKDGAEWKYRALLERVLGASDHYRGDGKTELTAEGGGSPPRDGYPEFLGPNARLAELPAVAVVGLGALRAGP